MTNEQVKASIATNLPDNTVGAITPAKLRTELNGMVDYSDTAVAGHNGDAGAHAALFAALTGSAVLPLAFTGAAIQSAITALGATGGVIQLLPGEYAIGAKITLASNIWIRGAGIGVSRLKLAAAVNDDMLSATGKASVRLSDMTIDADAANQVDAGKAAVKIVTCTDVLIENCDVKAHRANGVSCGGGSSRVIIRNCKVHDNTAALGMLVSFGGTDQSCRVDQCEVYNGAPSELAGGGYGVYIQGHNFQLTNTRIYNCSDEAIVADSGCTNLLIDGCYVGDTPVTSVGGGIHLVNVASGRVSNTRISNTSKYGITLTAAATPLQISGLSIADCGIRVADNGASLSAGFSWVGGSVLGCGKHGIEATGTGVCGMRSIELVNNGKATTGSGIYDSCTGSSQIIGCYFADAQATKTQQRPIQITANTANHSVGSCVAGEHAVGGYGYQANNLRWSNVYNGVLTA